MIKIFKDKEIKFIEFDKEYSSKIIKFLKEIAIDEFGYNDWEDYFRRMDFSEYKKDENKFWIALNKNGDVIGTIGAVRVSEDEIRMNSLYVHKDYRKLGVAKELYKLFIEFANERGYKVISLRTFFKFKNAINFYEKNSFIRYDEDEESYFYKKVY